MKKFFRENWPEITAILVGTAAINLLLLAKTYRGNHIDAQTAGQFGEFVGGYVGTIFLWISVVFLLATLRRQTKTFGENRFFQLLKYHRENVAEIALKNDSGRHVFVTFIKEFREVLKLLYVACAEADIECPSLVKIDIAYMAFYYGIGQNSSRILKESLRGEDPALVNRFIARLSEPDMRRHIKGKRHFAYTPFDGHQSRLGHYYRHLYHTVRYVDANADASRKSEYIKLLRSQLSNHEQALLALNSLSRVGADWRREDLIEKYQLIKNVPTGFFDPETEVDLKAVFPRVRFESENVAANWNESFSPSA